MMATEITSLMIDHLINEHNEVIGEIEAFKLLVIINKEILDTALKRMTNLKKHERWDNNTYHGLMRKVSNFLVYDDKCSLMTTYNNEGQFDVPILTGANNNAQSNPIISQNLDNTGDVRRIPSTAELINPSTRPKRIRMEEGTTPNPSRNLLTPNDSIGIPSSDILGSTSERIVYSDEEISYYPTVDDNFEDPFSSPLDLIPKDEVPVPIRQNDTALILFKAVESLANSNVTNIKDL